MMRGRKPKNRLRKWGEVHPHAYTALLVSIAVCSQALILSMLRVPFFIALLLIAVDSVSLAVTLWKDVRNSDTTVS